MRRSFSDFAMMAAPLSKAASGFEQRLERGEILRHPFGVARKDRVGHARLAEEGEQHLASAAVRNHPNGNLDLRAGRWDHRVIENAEIVPRGEPQDRPSVG